MDNPRPVLAFTSGDPAGVGPEVLVAALRDPRVRAACRAVAVGPRAALWTAGWRPALSPLVDPGAPLPRRLPRRPTAAGGLAAFAAAEGALDLARRGLVAGMVTAPASKEGWRQAHLPFLDHTEWLQARTRSRETAMMLLGGGMRAVLVTRHLPLKDVSGELSGKTIEQVAWLAHRALRGLLGRAPRIALCALNPHAGEGGMLGEEEEKVLRPAASRLRSGGMKIEGPAAADALFATHSRGVFDALLALYHDQALIPLKLAAGYGVVNWTLGVPVVRTAPGHGTAYDAAGTGRADPAGMVAAALWAARIARGRRRG